MISQATESDPDSPHAHFLCFKLAVLQSREDDGEFTVSCDSHMISHVVAM